MTLNLEPELGWVNLGDLQFTYNQRLLLEEKQEPKLNLKIEWRIQEPNLFLETERRI